MDQVTIKTQVAIAAGCCLSSGASRLLTDVSLIASCIAAITGAIVGVHAVWRIWRNRKKPADLEQDRKSVEVLEAIRIAEDIIPK